MSNSFNYDDYKIKIDDIIRINIKIPEEQSLFKNGINQNIQNVSKESSKLEGFQVDSDGFLNLPFLGRKIVLGLTMNELSNFLKNEIENRGILINPIIDLKLVNANFTILGEVNNPGKHEFLENNLNILEAIGFAGDLTINGKRNNITLIREKNNKRTTVQIDLTSTEIFSSPYFQIFSGDIIIVNPNTTRIKNAGIIGNSGTLLSLLSFVLSSIIVINN
tara:strand:+ start:478 stop:1137 length:660 start_codon:yes stop_codon:yes gene_type:complete